MTRLLDGNGVNLKRLLDSRFQGLTKESKNNSAEKRHEQSMTNSGTATQWGEKKRKHEGNQWETEREQMMEHLHPASHPQDSRICRSSSDKCVSVC